MSDGAFLGYIALLFVSAVALAVLAIGGFGQNTLPRVFQGIGAALFLGYSLYLLLFFDGGSVRIFFYAFAVPVLAVIQVVKSRKARAEAAAQPAFEPATQPAAAPPQQ